MPAMTSLFSGLSLAAIALAVMLSALIRLIQTGQLRARVEAGFAGVRELAELSGITDARDLQDVFGPPGMQRIWAHVTMRQIAAKRRLAGYLMSDRRLHLMSIAVAFCALGISHWIVELLLMIVALVQIGSWISATQLPK